MLSLNSYDFELGKVFLREAAEKGWTGDTLIKIAERRIGEMAESFAKMSDEVVFRELQREAASDLEFNENVRLIFVDKDKTKVEETTESSEEEDTEGGVDDRSGLNLVKYKLMNPENALSVRIKKLLGSLEKTTYTKDGRVTHKFNDLGYVERLNPQYAYYVLLNEFGEMKDAKDFDKIMNKLVSKYTWAMDIQKTLQADEDLRNEFYRAIVR